MNSVTGVSIEIAVVLGRARMPIQQLLRMGRGAVIELETHEDDQVHVLANNIPVAIGDIVVSDDKIAVEVSEILGRSDHER